MSINISLVVSSSEEQYSLKINSPDELIKYINTHLKLTHFNLITEKGEKISKRNLAKLNDSFTSLNPTNSLSFLIIPSSIQIKNESNTPSVQIVKEAIINQKKIKAILNAYFNSTIEKINAKLQLLNGLQIKYAKHKQFIDSSFNQSFGQFKTFFHYTDKDNANIQTDFDIIEQAVLDYKTISSLYQEQLKLINNKAKEMISAYEWNITNNQLREDRDDLALSERIKIRAYNTHLIQNMIEKESDSLKKDLLNKIAEISLYKKNLEHAMSITNIPLMFINDAKEIQNEVIQRKNFDFCFGKIMNFIQNNILVKEEERRKTFCVWLNLQNKNELYTKFINVLYENNTLTDTSNKNTNGNMDNMLNEVINQLDAQLNSLIQVLYQPSININESIEELKNVHLSKSEIAPDDDTNNFLNTVSFELSKVLKNHFKVQNQNDNNGLSLSSSKEKILWMIKIISEKTRNMGVGMNNQLLDISNASLAYSIMIDDKQQQYNQSYLNPNLSQNIITAEMEKFVLKHEDRLYFYESLYEFIDKFALQNKIHFKIKLNKDDPQSLGTAIEQILREVIEIRKKYHKYINLIRQLKNK